MPILLPVKTERKSNMEKERKNRVFIASSIDGYIADRDGGIEWLTAIPNPENNDMGYADFIAGTDAIVMGRNTFETVCGMDIDWPYRQPVFVLSRSMTRIPDAYSEKAELVKVPVKDLPGHLHKKGYDSLYIDGGKTIRSFLEEDLIDEMIITIIPCILGGGIPLFTENRIKLDFRCIATRIFLKQIVQHHFIRTR